MKKLSTLATLGALFASSFNAQAQVVVDGVLNASEIATGTTTTTGNYVLIGKFTNARGFGNAGLLSLYAATSATKITFFLGGTVEPNGNSFQLFFKTPASAGVPAGTALPTGPAGGGTVATSAGTSFEKMGAKLDMPTNLAIALRSATGGYKLEGISYTSATAATAEPALTGSTAIAGTGAVSTVTATTIPALASARVAYKNTSNSGIDMNPGNTTPTTGAAYGAAGSYGLEFELDRAAAGLTGTASIGVFALQNNGDGGYLSSDYIPQNNGGAGGNLATNPDFSTVPGLQTATLNLTATSITLGAKTSANEVALGVYPNPVADRTNVSYVVSTGSTPVQVSLLDLMGRTVRVVESGMKAAGAQTTSVSTANLAAGTYLVRVQIGDNIATSKVAVL